MTRRAVLVLCALHLLSTLERQVFDFLGFMWAPILANFLNILFIIFGFFGTFQSVAVYIYSYAIWNILWLMWNIFVICYYLNVGVLDRESGLLALGTESVSWWEINGWGCRVRWSDVDGGSWLRPDKVEGCFMHFSHVESLHAALQCIFGFLGIVLGFYHASNLSKADDAHTRKSTGNQSLYSVEFTRPAELRIESAAKPMTPRRVKRRSVSSRHSTRRSSRRSSQRRNVHHSNMGHTNPTYRQSSQHSLNDSYNDEDLYNNRPASVRSSYSNFHAARPISLHTDGGIFPEASYHMESCLPHSNSSPSPLPAEATPQVPQKRSMPDQIPPSVPYRIQGAQNTFFNSGPPAYHLHQGSHFPHPADTETVM